MSRLCSKVGSSHADFTPTLMNVRQNHTYFLHIFQSNTTVLCKSCEPEIALNSNQNCPAQYQGTRLVPYSVLNSKLKQFHDHKSCKMRESTLSWIGNFEENIDLSHIHSAVHMIM